MLRRPTTTSQTLRWRLLLRSVHLQLCCQGSDGGHSDFYIHCNICRYMTLARICNLRCSRISIVAYVRAVQCTQHARCSMLVEFPLWQVPKQCRPANLCPESCPTRYHTLPSGRHIGNGTSYTILSLTPAHVLLRREAADGCLRPLPHAFTDSFS